MKILPAFLLALCTSAFGQPADHTDAQTIYPKITGAIIGFGQLPDGRYAYLVDNQPCKAAPSPKRKTSTLAGKTFYVIADGDLRADPYAKGCAAQQAEGNWYSVAEVQGWTAEVSINWQTAPLHLDYVAYQAKKGRP